ncbi:MAG TPA: acylphosphatase [Nitrospira sp.]|jgi:acylphosphatase|nr:acylphosphatase [Nitrospira sp.]
MTDASGPAVRARISVSGRVQGVGYRAFTLRAASERGLVGGVRNCEDGRVELEAEGSKEKIISLIEALKIGPPASRIIEVRIEWVQATGRQTDFSVWY